MTLFQVEGLTKAHGSRRVLRGVDLAIAEAEVVGLVGANGAGKSTLGDVVAGTTAPDAGRMTLQGRPYAPLSGQDAHHLGVGVVEQLIRIDPALTVAQAVFRGTALAGRPQPELRARARELLADVELELSPDAVVGELPRFVHGLVEAARVLAEDTRLVVLDEVAAALAPAEVAGLHTVAQRLRQQGRGVLYISHRLPEMLALVDRVLVLRDGVIAVDAPSRDLDPVRLAAATLDGSVPVPRPRTPAAPDTLTLTVTPTVTAPAPRSTRPAPAEAPVALRVRNLRVPGRVEGVDLLLRRGEVVGLTGQRSSGIQEVAGALSGELPAQCDQVELHGEPRSIDASVDAAPLRLASYRPDHDGLDPGRTIARTLADEPWGRPGDVRTEIASLRRVIATVHRLNLATLSIRTAFGALSGGDQHKLALARWMSSAGDVVVVHEPTRGLDARSRRQVRRLLDEATAHGTTVLVVSVDPDELAECCDRVGVLAGGRVADWIDTHGMALAAVRARILDDVGTA